MSKIYVLTTSEDYFAGVFSSEDAVKAKLQEKYLNLDNKNKDKQYDISLENLLDNFNLILEEVEVNELRDWYL